MKFYNLSTDEGKRNRLFAGGVGIQSCPYERINCPVCNSIWAKIIDPDFRPVIALSNNNFPDFFGYDIFRLLSENAKNVLENAGITGFASQPTTILSRSQLDKTVMKELRQGGGVNVNKIAEEYPPYHYLEVTGKAKLHEKSEIKIETCSSCGRINLTTPGCS